MESLEEVMGVSRSKELDLRVNSTQAKPNGEGLNVKGRSNKKENNGKERNKIRSNLELGKLDESIIKSEVEPLLRDFVGLNS